MTGVDQEVVGQDQQALGDRAVERTRHLLHRDDVARNQRVLGDAVQPRVLVDLEEAERVWGPKHPMGRLARAEEIARERQGGYGERGEDGGSGEREEGAEHG